MIFQGKCWKFGNNINTDLIQPSKYYHLRSNVEELAKHVLEDVKPNFYKSVCKGDILVAGYNFGGGSAREHAPIIIKYVGISLIIANSFARIFYRNSINIGLPVAVSDTQDIDNNDYLKVDLNKGVLWNITKNYKKTLEPLPNIMEKILKEGGLKNYVKKRGDLKIESDKENVNP